MIDHQKIGIIGAGHVGSHVGCALLAQGLCRELVLLDTDRKKAVAQADDLQDMVGFAPRQARVWAGDYGDLGDAGIVVVCASGPICKEDRLEELAESVKVMDQILPGLGESGFSGILLVITNPVDLVARYLAERLSLPRGRVIGSGTTLDTARQVRVLARRTGTAQRSIQGMVIGEHGESQVCCWSQVSAGGVPVSRLMESEPGWQGLDLAAIGDAGRQGGWDILCGKGSTEFGIGNAAALIIRGVQGDEGRILPVSVPVRVPVSVPMPLPVPMPVPVLPPAPAPSSCRKSSGAGFLHVPGFPAPGPLPGPAPVPYPPLPG